MRLFVAVDVPEAIKESIESDVVGVLRDRVAGARWTRPEGRHLTLMFLGNVADERLDEIGDALACVATGQFPFDACFAEIGGFPNLRRPRVLWIGLGEGAEPMGVLATKIERELEALGLEAEGRPFRGHLTLARFPRPHVVEALPDVVVPRASFGVREIVLFHSQLHPKGARYTALRRFPLGAKD